MDALTINLINRDKYIVTNNTYKFVGIGDAACRWGID